MYQLNRDKPEPSGWVTKTRTCKLLYIGKEIVLDRRHIQEFRCPYIKKSSKEEKMIQKALGMPSLHSPDVLPNYETANMYKPYVYIDGEVKTNGSDVIVDIGTKQKSTYENGVVTAPFMGDFVCKIVGDGYVSNDIVVGKEYVESGIFYTSSQQTKNDRTQIIGKVSEKTMNNICKSVFALCEKNLKGIFDEKENNVTRTDKNSVQKKTMKKLAFRILILPDSIKNPKITREKPSTESMGTDSFKNEYFEIPSSVHKLATYATIDDMTYMLNPTNTSPKEEFVRYWGSHPVIGNLTFKKIGMNLARDFYDLSGFKWYFGSHDVKFTRERRAPDDDNEEIGSYKRKFSNGIWNQLYEGMKQATQVDSPEREIMIMCIKNPKFSQVEIILCESVTVALLKKSLLVNGLTFEESQFSLSDTYNAMEEVILKVGKKPGTKSEKKPDWFMYMESVMDILAGRKKDRGRLVQYITAKFRERYIVEDWKHVKNKKKAARFLRKAWFVIAALASPYDRNAEMDDAEEYAYRMGKLVGAYAKFAKLNNMIELELQPSTRCDTNMLRKTFVAITKKLSLLRRTEDLDSIISDIKRHMPSKELEPIGKKRDLTLYFYMGLFKEL